MKIIPHRLYGFRVRPTTKVCYFVLELDVAFSCLIIAWSEAMDSHLFLREKEKLALHLSESSQVFLAGVVLLVTFATAHIFSTCWDGMLVHHRTPSMM